MSVEHKLNADHSKFWLGEDFDSKQAFGEDSTMGLIRLAAYRRAISNFVYILTNKSIPVRFVENNKSWTNSKVIYIGGELSQGEFDPTVGLSLHEASHIVKSDFGLIKATWGKVPPSLVAAGDPTFTPDMLGIIAKYILNVVEDRYIDAWARLTAPGYRGYYDALYEKYFLCEEITVGLKSSAFRIPTVQNYKFRFVNIMNPASEMDALPALRKISEILDLPNILRPELKTQRARMDLAFAITEEIIKSVMEYDEQKKQEEEKESSGNGDPDSGKSEDSSETSEDTPDATEDDDTGGIDEEDEPDSEEGEDEEGNTCSTNGDEESPPNLSDEEKDAVKRATEAQDDFMSHEIKQSSLSQDVLDKLQTLEKSDVNLVFVGGEEDVPVTQCIVVKNMTKELMMTPEFPYTSGIVSVKNNSSAAAGVVKGIALGSMLGRRLQLRGEVRTTKFTRLPKGKIDRRLLPSMGYDAENLFYQTAVDKFKNIHLHVTVDASFSMVDNWEVAMTTVVALAKAASMINNVGMSISFRSGISAQKRSIEEKDKPEVVYVVIAYDSRKDKFSKVISLFPMLFPNGSTPEGLAFQAILDCIPSTTHELDSYFVNVSDGEPAFGRGHSEVYCGLTAARHTKKQVNKIRENGVSVLSYFIEDAKEIPPNPDAPKEDGDEDDDTPEEDRDIECRSLFREMYGRDAHFIDMGSVTQIAHTLNKRFLSKENSAS